MTTRDTDHHLLTVYEISKLLASSLDLRKTLRAVLKALAAHAGWERSLVTLRGPDGLLHVAAYAGLSAAEIGRATFKPGEGVTGRVYQSGVPAVIPDIAAEPAFLQRASFFGIADDQPVEFLALPVRSGRDCIGVLGVLRAAATRGPVVEREMRFLAMVANLIGQTVRLHETVAAEREELVEERKRLRHELQGRYAIGNVVGVSKRMQDVFAEVHLAAPSRSTVLLRGESGTGKEVIARAIHYLSPRREQPFVKLNCAALPETLLESELFGHEKGAFTGASQERKGRFEQAHGGTLFLDEIGDISPAFQAKLLRVLQEREFERVGGNRTIRVDVRLITATNRDLETMVREGSFRDDLYYRINVVVLHLPPLRERREDIPALIDHFLTRYNRDNGRDLRIEPDALEVLRECPWPGNVRELENCVERTATMTRGTRLRAADLRCVGGQCLSRALAGPCNPECARPVAEAADATRRPQGPEGSPASRRETLIDAMDRCGWVQAKAARLLHLTPRQLGYALRKHGIPIKRL